MDRVLPRNFQTSSPGYAKTRKYRISASSISVIKDDWHRSESHQDYEFLLPQNTVSEKVLSFRITELELVGNWEALVAFLQTHVDLI